MSTDAPESEDSIDEQVSRRDFVKAVGGLTALSAGGAGMTELDLDSLWKDDPQHYVGTDFGEYDAGDVIHTTCGQCNTFCPIKVRLDDGDTESGQYTSLVRKLAGNPYSFLNTQPYAQVPYASDPEAVATGNLEGTGDVDLDAWSLGGGRICLKGQAGIQTAFDSYRVRKPLKRVGDRGSDEWTTISWDQAIEEIVHGDEDGLGHRGLSDMWEYVPEDQVMADRETMDEEAFRQKYEDKLVDPEIPELGPKANQIVDVGGFRRFLIRARFFSGSLGTINSHHHAGVCGFSSVLGNVRSHGNQKKRQYSDIENTEYLLVWGTNPMVSNKGPTWLSPKISNALSDGMRMDVVDPRLSKTAEKAEKWVPVKPGADGALAMGMSRWIVENERYDEGYLTNPGQPAADADDETTYSDATHLVAVEDDPTATPKAKTATADALGVAGSRAVLDAATGEVADANDVDRAVLDVDTTIRGTAVKSVWTLYKERLYDHDLAEYAEMAGVDVDDIVEVAGEFTSHGKRAAIMQYRGPSMHTNGFYNTRAIATLQHLIGNYDWKGGQITPYAGYGTMGGRYQLGNVPDGRTPWGLPITRALHNAEDFEGTRLFPDDDDDPYPAQRPWFRLSPQHQVQEIYASAAEEYPYDINALFVRPYSENHVMAAAGGDQITEVLQDQDSIELLVAFDTVIGEMSKEADYILPEPTYLERWENFGTYPNKRLADDKISQPAVRVIQDPENENPRMSENVLIDILTELEDATGESMPGVGEGAILDANGEEWPLHDAEDFYLKMVANLGFQTKTLAPGDLDEVSGTINLPPGLDRDSFPYEEGPVPDADDEELEIFKSSHEKGLGDYFDYEAWKGKVKPEEWRKVVTVLNRGGRYEDPIPNYEEAFAKHGHDYDYAGRYNPSNAYVGEKMRYRLDGEVQFWNEIMPVGKSAYDGEPFDPLPDVRDVTHFNGDVLTPVVSDEEPDRPLHLINWKPRTQGMHRTMNSPWLRETRPENPVWINPDDADPRGIENGDDIEIDAGRTTVEATAMVTEGIRPGVVGTMWGWGRSDYGAVSQTIDGERGEAADDGYGHTPYEFDEPMREEAGYASGRDAGFAINHLAPLDAHTEDIGPTDQVGGSQAQYDTHVDITKLE
ncbi:molybdopterin-dependent oxidoreductase [Halanaeroarchaeum sulfurireducens]|uniref:Molybdopterin oxidoreductase, molybdopterin-binding subunit n=1 Tax=Halanaeroarchaeum sulfurireducens TaxID=1604004 RepID=A0A0F7PBK6_9EURY|nr:molybdopterin-dependent oxidoreductase [Halanaeroarchaeum sulfurireducens]AKH97029.1 molybdopterin oxidoreductase, molybdopterin-binding subunit [Halanaeroarchaeum sulfurireducens]